MFTTLLERVRRWAVEPDPVPVAMPRPVGPLRAPCASRPLTVLPLLAHAPAIVALQQTVADLQARVLRLEEAIRRGGCG